MSDIDHERTLDAEEMLVLDRARWLCGGRPGPAPECLPPDIEAEAIAAFSMLSEHLEAAILSPGFTEVCRKVDEERQQKHHPQVRQDPEFTDNNWWLHTPSTLEALKWVVSDGGLAALKAPLNQKRLRSLSQEQRDELNAYIARVISEKKEYSHVAA